MLQTLPFFLTSFVITYLAIPSIIRLANLRNLFEPVDERKNHKKKICALGGIAIFSGVLFSILFWTKGMTFELLRWIVLSLIIVFLLGLKDDIVALNPVKKLVGLLIACGLVIIYGDVRVLSFHGLLGITELSYVSSIVFTLFVFIVVTNAFNLIDGIDGLAGGIGTISSIAFGTLFLYAGNSMFAAIAFATAGSLIAFLRFNLTPAKIFMGDGGALLIGFIISLLCTEFLNTTITLAPLSDKTTPVPLLALSILIIPLVDTLRVFIIRIANKRSPFSADRNHLHHILVDLGLSHSAAAMVLFTMNIYYVILTVFSADLDKHMLLLFIILNSYLFSQIPFLILRNRSVPAVEHRKRQPV